MKFADTLRFLRNSKNITQKELAEQLSVDKRQISKLETQYNEPNIDMLIKLADYFGCSVDYLLGREREDGIIVVNGQQQESIIPKELENIYIKLDSMHRNILIGIARNVLEAQKQGA